MTTPNDLERYFDEELIPQLSGRLYTPEGEAEALAGILEALEHAVELTRERIQELRLSEQRCEICQHYNVALGRNGLGLCVVRKIFVAPCELCRDWRPIPKEATNGK